MQNSVAWSDSQNRLRCHRAG